MSGRSQQISLQPAVLRWARARAGFSQDELAAKMRVKVARVQAWERSGTINIQHADRLAHCTYYTSLGQLYPDAPREDTLRIPDFRVQGPRVGSPTLRPGGVQGTPRDRTRPWLAQEVAARDHPTHMPSLPGFSAPGRRLDLAEPKYPHGLAGRLLELFSDHPLPVFIQMPSWDGKLCMPIFLISLLITYRKIVTCMRHPA